MPSVEEIVARHGAGIKDSKIWFAPNIPANKLQGALRSYAQAVSPNDVLMLVDNTIWGGCGDGMMITRDRLYAHDMASSVKTMSISEIKTANVVGAFAPELWINGSKFVTFNCIDIHGESNHVKICLLVTELGSGASPSVAAAPALPGAGMVSEVQECPGCGATVRGLAVCSYCGRKL
jgi:hypothetical protein